MNEPTSSRPPSLDTLLARPALRTLIDEHGRTLVVSTARELLDAWRNGADDQALRSSAGNHALRDNLSTRGQASPKSTSADAPRAFDAAHFDQRCASRLAERQAKHFRPVFNLTGTVLHTNLGRATMAQEAIDAVAAVMRGATNLEYRIADGARGDRDDHIEGLLRELTGAQAATAVNNNAAAVLLVLAALADRKEVPVSRGELIEIGGSFRIPDIMRRAGAKLVEVGTTNRTHAHDFQSAIGPRTALVMRVHASNYAIQGFTAGVALTDLAALCRERGVPLVEDLGSGTLVDLRRWGLPGEPTPQQSLAAGVNLVTFSGDKLLGGPQAGLVVGDAALIAKIKKHPLKRALRLDKMTIAALEATLTLYRDPDRLAERLPVLRLLTRPPESMRDVAASIAAALAKVLGAAAHVEIKPAMSQIGSGSLPVERLPSLCVAVRAANAKRAGRYADALAAALRALPVPVIGRIADGELRLDVRCLDDVADALAFVDQLSKLVPPTGR